jgi:hypothetical protein
MKLSSRIVGNSFFSSSSSFDKVFNINSQYNHYHSTYINTIDDGPNERKTYLQMIANGQKKRDREKERSRM